MIFFLFFKCRPQYMTAYFIGEGFSGLIPSLVALAQGSGSMECIKPLPSPSVTSNFSIETANVYNQSTTLSNMTVSTESTQSFTSYPVYKAPNFSVRVFFLFLMFLVICSGIAFTLLNYWSHCKKDHVSERSSLKDSETNECLMKSSITVDTNIDLSPEDKSIPVTIHSFNSLPIYDCNRIKKKSSKVQKLDMTHSNSQSDLKYDSISIKSKPKSMTRRKYALFLILTGWLNALSNGVLPSLQTYSCLPYGIETYHLSVTLANIANPVACFATFALTMTSVLSTLGLSVLGSGLAGYVIYTAISSPQPPLVEHSYGPIIVVST